jgi:hypothetical protein
MSNDNSAAASSAATNGSSSNGSNGTPAKPSVEELRAEIQQTRADLGETVQALAAKADVKARAKDQVEQTKLRVKAQAADAAGRVRDVAATATGKVRAATAQATDQISDTDPREVAAEVRARTGQVPLTLVFAGVMALAGIILIVRGRRR